MHNLKGCDIHMIRYGTYVIFGILLGTILVTVLMETADMAERHAPMEARGMIPDEAIRLRILAHSDLERDQRLKEAVRDQLIMLMEHGSQRPPQSMDEARYMLKKNMGKIRNAVEAVLSANGHPYGYQIHLGMTPFPKKTYGQFEYPAGNYEALLITLGDGAGKNWWCAVFPALCHVEGATVPPLNPTPVKPLASELKEKAVQRMNDQKEPPKPRFWLWEVVRRWF